MKANERLKYIIENEGLNPKIFSERLGFERPQSIYDVLKNKTKNISENLAFKIISVFPKYSKIWLLTGEGDILNNSTHAIQATGNEIVYKSTIKHDNLADTLQKLTDEIAEQRKTYTDLLAKKDEQIEKLLNILAK